MTEVPIHRRATIPVSYYLHRGRLDPERCEMEVERYHKPAQCARQAVTRLGGHGWCAAHAERIKRECGTVTPA